MIQWLKDWSYRSKHIRTAWENIAHKEDNSLTIFQNLCNKELLKVFQNNTDLIKHQSTEGTAGKYIVGILPNSDIKYWIYEDGAEINDRRLERWDYETPEPLIDNFILNSKEIYNLAKRFTGLAESDPTSL